MRLRLLLRFCPAGVHFSFFMIHSKSQLIKADWFSQGQRMDKIKWEIENLCFNSREKMDFYLIIASSLRFTSSQFTMFQKASTNLALSFL